MPKLTRLGDRRHRVGVEQSATHSDGGKAIQGDFMHNTVPADGLLQGVSHSVVVVDDDEFSQEILTEMLGQLGVHDVQVAGGGREGLQILGQLQGPPDYLICDVYMPDMDGIEFLEQLAKRRYAGAVILVSGAHAEMLNIVQDVARADGIKILGALTKPLRLHALSQMMANFPKAVAIN